MKNIERTDDCFDNPWERDGEICEIHNEEILLDPVEMAKVCLHCKFNFPSDNQAFSVHWIDPPAGFIGGEIATTRKNILNCKLENGLMDRQEYIEMKTKELFEALKISH